MKQRNIILSLLLASLLVSSCGNGNGQSQSLTKKEILQVINNAYKYEQTHRYKLAQYIETYYEKDGYQGVAECLYDVDGFYEYDARQDYGYCIYQGQKYTFREKDKVYLPTSYQNNMIEYELNNLYSESIGFMLTPMIALAKLDDDKLIANKITDFYLNFGGLAKIEDFIDINLVNNTYQYKNKNLTMNALINYKDVNYYGKHYDELNLNLEYKMVGKTFSYMKYELSSDEVIKTLIKDFSEKISVKRINFNLDDYKPMY